MCITRSSSRTAPAALVELEERLKVECVVVLEHDEFFHSAGNAEVSDSDAMRRQAPWLVSA